MTDILNTEQLQNILGKLKADSKPLWGKMSPQHIVEHLGKSMQMSYGKFKAGFYFTKEEADKLKEKLIYGDAQLSPGIKNPSMGDEPPPLLHPDLDTAHAELNAEILNFTKYYELNPAGTNTHPRMGELKHKEWLVFHSKHFTHHFKQYGLL
jgi:hypothetical protein